MRVKKNLRVAAVAVILVFATAMLCGCTVKAEKGEGGIVPDGYKMVSAYGSTLYFPPNYNFAHTTEGVRYYTFAGGNANIIESEGSKVTSMKKWMYQLSLKNEFKRQGYDADVNVAAYKYYELSGLLILYTEVIVRLDSRTVYEYQIVYNAGDKQVTVTLAYEDKAPSEEVPYNILHSVSLK